MEKIKLIMAILKMIVGKLFNKPFEQRIYFLMIGHLVENGG